MTSDPTPRPRAALDSIPAYVPGRPPQARPGLVPYKLSSNENPYEPLPGVLHAAARAASAMNRYPDMGAVALYEALAEHFGVPADRLALGTGSVAVLYHLLQAFCEPGDEVVYAWRAFEAYPIAVQVTGARSVQVPLAAGARHDLPAMAAAITDRTKAVIVCSPNNPTGPAVTAGELDAFAEQVPGGVLIVLDEAYREFVTDENVPDGIEWSQARPNVVVLRTFSKAYGLAGLRVGFAVAAAPVAAAVRACALPFGVPQIAQDAAVASLGAEDELLDRVDSLVAERDRAITALRDLGWDVPDSQANFVWLATGADTVDFAARCGEQGLMVRPFANEGCRITIAETEATDRLLEMLAAERRE